MTAPLQRALALSSPSQIGCRKCDTASTLLDTIPIPAILRMRDHLTFVPPLQEGGHGYFCYDRLYTSLFKYLPDGEQEARASTRRVIRRLNQFGGALAKEASYKLVKSYLSGHCSWLTPFDQQEKKLTYISIIAILSLHNESSGVRICLVPTRVFTSSQNKPLTYNDCVTELPARFPKPLRFALQDLFGYGSLQADIQAMYNSVRYNAFSSLQTLTFCLRTADNRPTFSLDKAVDTTLHCLKSNVLEWGMRDAPNCAQQCLALCVSEYRAHHPTEAAQPLLDFMLKCVQDIVNEAVHMDDVNGGLSFPMLHKYAQITKRVIPMPTCACTTEVCQKNWREEGGLPSCPSAKISPELWQEHCEFIKIITKDFLKTLAQVMCDTFSFCGFRLKYLRSPQCEPHDFDHLIQNQVVTVPSDKDIKVDRPSSMELRETICKMKTQSNLYFEKKPVSLPGSQVHLSHCYDGTRVALNINHLVITCLLGNARKKSPELYCLKHYQEWRKKEKPTFCKRSLFSLLHANFCFTGKWLSLFKMVMKILIRTTLIHRPDLTWDDPLGEETVEKMELAIQLYFILTKETILKPDNFNSYLSVYYIYLFSDASAQIMAYTITILSVTNLQGKRVVKSHHLLLNTTAAHIAALSVPHLELLSLLRGVLALQEVLAELEGVGISVAPQNRRAGVDSKVILQQCRSAATHFIKRTAHTIARLQLLFHSLSMSPFTELGYQDQSHPGVTFFPDLLTKMNGNSTVDSLVHTYKRLMDTSWMDTSHPLQLPGWNALVALPRLTDQDWMQLGGVLEGELDVFRKNIMSHSGHPAGDQNQVKLLIHSAATVVKEPEGGDEGDVVDNDGGDIDDALDNAWEEDEEDEEVEGGEGDHTVGGVDGGRDSEGGAAAKKPPQKPERWKDDDQRKRIVEQPHNGHLDGGDDDHSEWGQREPTMPSPSTLPSTSWCNQMADLIERHHTRGLGQRGVIPILINVLLFITKLRHASRLGPQERLNRQKSRKQQHQKIRRQNLTTNLKPTINFKDEHFNWSENVDLSESCLGDFDHLWISPPTQFNESFNQLAARAFQHLLDLFRSTKPARGFTHQTLKTNTMRTIHVLQGRRQRNFIREGFHEVRLRPVQENTALERLLLWTVHRFSLGQGLHKALNGLSFLNLYISQAERKLQKISSECAACCRRRASLGRTNNKVKIERKGPTDNTLLATRWLAGWSITLSDLHGPIYLHLSPGSPATKNYIICFLELPLKNLTSILVQSLSAADLLLALETYATQRGRACDLFYSDYGSNYSRYQDTFSEMQPLDEADELEKDQAWKKMLMAIYTKKKTHSSAIRFSQGRHEVLGPVEHAQFQIKACLHAFNIHRREEPLTFHQWSFLLSCVAQVVASRPLLIHDGKVFSPNTILRLLGEVGRGEGQHGLTFHSQGDRDVTRELQAKAQEIKQMREKIADVLLAHLVKKYFLDITPREQKLRSKGTECIQVGDIFMCPRIFKETANVTASLLQLKQKGASQNHGLFKRTSTHKGQRTAYVGRGFRELFFIATGTGTTKLGDPTWQAEALPTFQLSKVCPRSEQQLQAYDTFEEVEESTAGNEANESKNKGGEEEVKEDEEETVRHRKRKKEKTRRKAAVRERTVNPARLSPDILSPANQVVTRSGRVIKPPNRF